MHVVCNRSAYDPAPRMMRGGREEDKKKKAPALSEEAKAALETIRVEFHDVHFSGAQREVRAVAVAAASVSGVNKDVAHSAKTSSATASGAQLATAAASYVCNVYDRVDKICDVILRYGTKSQLQIRRVIDRDDDEGGAVARPRARKQERAAAAAGAPQGGANGAAGVGAGVGGAGGRGAEEEAERKRVKREAAVTNNTAPVDLTGRFAGAAAAAEDDGGVICLDD